MNNLELRVAEAVRHFWKTRQRQERKQGAAGGRRDQGSRSAVTGGAQLEALGSAADLWTAYREGAFRESPRPWLGCFMLLEEAPRSRSPVAVSEPHFRVFQEFRNASYAKRYELFCQKPVRERLYDSACFLLSDKAGGPKGKFREPSPRAELQELCGFLDCTGHGICETAGRRTALMADQMLFRRNKSSDV